MTAAQQVREFTIGSSEDQGTGILFTLDMTLMIRPARPGQLHKSCPHDTGRIHQVMDLIGEDRNPIWFFNTLLSYRDAHRLMDRGWYAYFDGYSMERSWIDATVVYVGANGKTIGSHGYGFSDGQITGSVQVYCAEFWSSLSDQSDWGTLLRHAELTETQQHVGWWNLEDLALAGEMDTPYPNQGGSVLIVRPSQVDPGYTVRGFKRV